MATLYPINSRLAEGSQATVEIDLVGFDIDPDSRVFIDVAMAGGAAGLTPAQHPQLGLIFRNAAGVALDPAEIVFTIGNASLASLNGNELVLESSAPLVFATNIVDVRQTQPSSGRYRLELSVFSGSDAPARVSLRVLNRAPDAVVISAEGLQPRWFTCVYSNTNTDLDQPRLYRLAGAEDFSLKTSILHDEVGRALPFANIGTGGTVTLTGTLPGGGPFALPSSSASATVGDINASLELNFTGATRGLAAANLSLASTTGENEAVTLQASAGRVEVVFLGDASGSMGWTEAGVPTSPPNQRWNHLQSAVIGFANSLSLMLPAAPAGQTSPGLVEMLVFSSTDTPTSLLAGGNAIPVDRNWTTSEMDVNGWFSQPAATPGGGTAFFTALRAVIGPIGSTSEFLQNGDDVTFNRRYLVAMTDGASNTGLSINQFETDSAALLAGTAVGGRIFAGAKNIHFIGVPYGAVGGTDVNRDYIVRVANLAGADHPDLHHVFTTEQVQSALMDSGVALQEAFRLALRTTLGLSASDDPLAEISSKLPRFTRERIVISADRRIEFYVHIPSGDERVVLNVYSPDCKLVHSEMPGVAVRKDAKHRMLSVDLREFAACGLQAVGTWRMVVERRNDDVILDAAAASASGSGWRIPFLFDHSLISDLELDFDTVNVIAGEPIDLNAKLTYRGLPLPHASVTVHLDQPGQGDVNWLAGTPVDAEALAQARRELAGQDVTDEQIKAHALGLRQQSFDRRGSKSRLDFADPTSSGHYALQIPNTAVPGSYKLRVVAVGELDNGEIYRRERAVSVVVTARPTPEASLVNIDYVRDRNGTFTAVVHVLPKDAFGNLFFTDPVASGLVQVIADKGKWAGAVVNNFDGSYTRTLSFDPGESPKIDVVIGGVVLAEDVQLPQLEDLCWMDRVTKYKPGSEGAPGANQHTNPKTLVGDISFDKPNEFLSLGGRGSVSGSFHGGPSRLVKELWVFAQPDARPKRYKVEVRKGRTWHLVGQGAGTRGFKLDRHDKHDRHGARRPHGGGNGIEEVRVTDLSADILDSAGKPSSQPGTSLRGIGLVVRKLGGHH